MLWTNLQRWAPADMRKTCIQLRQAEAAFRVPKTDLQLRPIWHQLEERIQAHVLFSSLAYILWKTLEPWMARSGLGSPGRRLAELAPIKVVDMILPPLPRVHFACTV